MSILLISGLWLDASVWDDVVRDLQVRGQSATAVRLPGVDDGDISATLDDQLKAVMNAAAAADPPVWLVGHSAAATLAWLVADAEPDLIAGVVMVGGFPAVDGELYADLFPMTDGAMHFPGWETFEGPDSEDLDDEVRQRFEARAIPVPEGVARGVVRVRDAWRADMPIVLVCPEYSVEDAREWVEGGDVPALGRATRASYADIASGHWPMLTAPAELAQLIDDVAT